MLFVQRAIVMISISNSNTGIPFGAKKIIIPPERTMDRTTRYKLFYFGLLAAIAAVLFTVALILDQWLAALAIGVLLFIPGRIQRHFWRDFHEGRGLLESGHPEEAIGCFERFIQRLRDNPRLAGYIWLGSSLYTRSAEAMAQSNLGAAWLSLHRMEEAEVCLRRAIELDNQYPVPWVNLAVLAMLRGETQQARVHLLEAQSRGMSRVSIDRIRAAADALKISG